MATVKDALATQGKNIETQTGKSIAKWVELARAGGGAKHGEMVKWLKEKHGLGHGQANYIAKAATKTGDGQGDGDDGDEGLVAAQFAGGKAALRPLYEKLVEMVRAFGDDVEIAPKKNNVSVRRKKQFALFQPSTSSRLDVGLILKGVAPSGRLEASGSFNAMFTHRVRITEAAEIDAELGRWLKKAYDGA